MSRIGKRPVVIPNSLSVEIDNGKITFKNNKSHKVLDTKDKVIVKLDGGNLTFEPLDNTRHSLALWGTYRALANNIVIGLVEGFTKSLEINGVGYRAAINGKNLELFLGYSHSIIFPIPDGISITVDKNVIKISGDDKQEVGQVAAIIRGYRRPEPYKGKGIRYAGEVIVRKAGKTSKK